VNEPCTGGVGNYGETGFLTRGGSKRGRKKGGRMFPKEKKDCHPTRSLDQGTSFEQRLDARRERQPLKKEKKRGALQKVNTSKG